ncbi:MAG TPA: hypothetical protein VL404_01690 [Candidatus Eisenbacteria bacterium]|nr:hypothetical protein [Candidatus Eisenbacteria bacterium]
MKPSLAALAGRAWRKLCPACGGSSLFEGGALRPACPSCGLLIRSREPDTWFFMYVSTAGITGIFVVLMLLVVPANRLLGRVAVGAAAIAAFFLTNPLRKSFAIALDYLAE